MIKFALVYSKKDEAGKNIAEQLKKFFLPQIPLIEAKKELIHLEKIDEKEEKLKNADILIFISKHESKNSSKVLTIHAPGNWRNNEFGGRLGKVCPTSANALKFLFQKLKANTENSNLEYEVSMESTHHGPFLNKPAIFLEIGSSEEQWKDKRAAEAIAKTIIDFQEFKSIKDNLSAIGISVNHYCKNLNKIQLEDSGIALSHVIARYSLPLSENMILESIEKTLEQVKIVLIDSELSEEEKSQITKILERLKVDYEYTNKI